MVTAETKPMHQCRCNVLFTWKSISRKKSVLLAGKFPFLVLARTMIMLSSFRSIICLTVVNGRLERKGNLKLLALKVVAVVYDRWSLTRGSKYRGLTWKLWYRGTLVAEEAPLYIPWWLEHFMLCPEFIICIAEIENSRSGYCQETKSNS